MISVVVVVVVSQLIFLILLLLLLLLLLLVEGSHVGFSNLYQACIYKRSRTSSDSGDLHLKVKVTGYFF